MGNELQIQTDAVDGKIAAFAGFSDEQVAVIKKTVAKNTTNTELAFFLQVCHANGLNPFLKEAWCYKDNKGNLIVFAGRDGFLKKAQENPAYNGIRSSEVRAKDVFKIDIANNKIEHEFGIGDRGEIVGAYAIAFRKNGEPTIEYVDFSRYNKKHNTWNTHPEEMIKKVAEVHALKKGFGLSCLQAEDEFNIENGVALPLASDPIAELEYELSAHREENELSNRDFVLKVCKAEGVQKMTKGALNHMRKVLFEDKKYDFQTGEKNETI